MQAYSDPKRASDPHALPNVETFYVPPQQARAAEQRAADFREHEDCTEAGWYWRACFPGCLPDSDPIGPFTTESEALADAQADASDDEESEVQP